MRYSTLISLAVAFITASLAVVGVAVYLNKQEQAQQQRLAAEQQTRVSQRVLISRRFLAFGEQIARADVALLDWHAETVPQGYFTELDELFVPHPTGQALPRYALANIQAGEPLHELRVSAPGAQVKLSSSLTVGRKAISIRVNDVLGVAGFVLPGDHVDVLSTRTLEDATQVDVILQDVKVLAVDQVADQQTDQPSVVRTVTFDVTMQEAQILTLGANVGTLSLALRHLNDRQQQPTKLLLSAPKEDINEAPQPQREVPQQALPTKEVTAPKTVVASKPEVTSLQQPLVIKPEVQIQTPILRPQQDTIVVIRGVGESHSYQVPHPIVVESIVPTKAPTKAPTNHALEGGQTYE